MKRTLIIVLVLMLAAFAVFGTGLLTNNKHTEQEPVTEAAELAATPEPEQNKPKETETTQPNTPEPSEEETDSSETEEDPELDDIEESEIMDEYVVELDEDEEFVIY